MCATFRAWRQKIAYVLLRGREAKAAAAPVVEHRGNAAEEEGERKPATDGDEAQTSNATSAQEGPAWNKTDHEFLPASVLERYRRLLARAAGEGFVEPGHLEDAVGSARARGVRLGQELLRQGLVEERHLTQAYALQQQSMYVRAQPDLVLLELMDRMPFAAADRFAALPLVESEKGWIVAVDDDLSCAERDELAFLLGEPTFFLFSSTADRSKRSGGSRVRQRSGSPQPAGAATLLEETSESCHRRHAGLRAASRPLGRRHRLRDGPRRVALVEGVMECAIALGRMSVSRSGAAAMRVQRRIAQQRLPMRARLRTSCRPGGAARFKRRDAGTSRSTSTARRGRASCTPPESVSMKASCEVGEIGASERFDEVMRGCPPSLLLCATRVLAQGTPRARQRGRLPCRVLQRTCVYRFAQVLGADGTSTLRRAIRQIDRFESRLLEA
ncbi:MAG: hypothetical protein ACLTMP_10465 [Eggerthella lenta]